jgi:hypothetical protein
MRLCWRLVRMNVPGVAKGVGGWHKQTENFALAAGMK